MSYPQQSQQGNLNSLADGVSLQFPHIVAASQKNSPQNVGINKFISPTTLRNDVQQKTYQQFAPLQNVQQTVNTKHLINGGSGISSRSVSPAVNTSYNQAVRNSIISNGQPTVSSSLTSLDQSEGQNNPTYLNLSGSMQSLSIGGGTAVPIRAVNVTANRNQQSQNLPINNYNANHQINIKSFAKNQKYSSGNLSQQDNQFESQEIHPQTSTTTLAISPPITNNPTIVQQSIFPTRPNAMQYDPTSKPITHTAAANLPPKSSNQQQSEYIINQNGSTILPGTENNMAISDKNFKPLNNYNISNNSNIQYQQSYQQDILSSEQNDLRKPSYTSQGQQYPAIPQHQHQAHSTPQFLPIQQQNYQSTFNGQSNSAPLQYQSQTPQISQQRKIGPSVTQQGFNKLWGYDTVDLMQNRHILSQEKVQPPVIRLNHQLHDAVNCSPDIFRCTVTKIPESNSLLQKSRLPLGILIHPFRDLNIDAKRIREKNSDETEKQLLLALIEQHSSIIEDKNNNLKLIPKKRAAWSDICGQMGAAGYCRTETKIKDQWHRMKVAARKRSTLSRKSLIATGNIQEVHQPSDLEKQIQSIIQKDLLDDDILIDSNSFSNPLGQNSTAEETIVEILTVDKENDSGTDNTLVEVSVSPNPTEQLRSFPKVQAIKQDVLSQRQNHIKKKVTQAKNIYEVRMDIENQKLLQVKNQIRYEELLFQKEIEIKDLNINMLKKNLKINSVIFLTQPFILPKFEF